MEKHEPKEIWQEPVAESEKQEKNENENDAITWDEFIQNTTIHGVRYIFDRSFRIRRVIWFAVVMAAVACFVGQVGERIAIFFQYKTNVGVKVVYDKKIDFPAVTICNQNSYRISATVDENMYQFIDSVYDVDNDESKHRSDSNQETETLPKGFDDVNTTRFVLKTAHQKRDLIERCSWQGQRCDKTNDFRMILTDLGVCYTFNAHSPPRVVEETDSGNALSLLLNVEQYEYMRGPQNDAGVKIHLHDQDEVPIMKSKGFAVAPGTHTLVAIERTKITNLPHPYGDCEDDNPVPVSRCKLNCKTKKLVEICGCHDVYMEPFDSKDSISKECSIKLKYSCVFRKERTLSNQTNCDCEVPCERVLYKPNLSYGQLSRFNAERFIITNESVKERLESKFHHALEVSQRNAKEIKDKDDRQMDDLQNAFDELLSQIEKRFTESMTSMGTFVKAREAVDIFSTDILEKDRQLLKGESLQGITSFTSPDPKFHVDLIYHNREVLWKLMAFTDGGKTSKTVEFLRFCANDSATMTVTTTVEPSSDIEPSATHVASDGISSALTFALSSNSVEQNETQIAETIHPEVDTSSLPWVTINSTDACDAMFEEMKKYHSDIAILKTVIYGKGLSNLDKAFVYGGSNYRKKEKYRDCFAVVDEAQGLVDSFLDTLELSLNMTESDSIAAALSYGEKIMSLYDEFLTPKITYDRIDTKIKETCSWVQDLVDYTNAETKNSREEIQKAMSTFGRASNFVYRLKHEFGTLNSTVHSEVYSAIKAMSKYESGKLTKLGLTKYFGQDDKNNLIAKNNEVKDLTRGYLSEMQIGEETLKNVYKAVLELEIPIFNRYSITKFELAKKLFEVYGDDLVYENRNRDSETESDEASDNNETASKFLNYIKDNMENLRDPIKDIDSSVITRVDDLISNIQILSRNLQDYETSTIMDSAFYLDNFIQVDIFYQVLSYEEIEENKAFEFLSLLSEIGGFLGLLLGASVLTVCELVDYITLLVINKYWKKRNKIKDLN